MRCSMSIVLSVAVIQLALGWSVVGVYGANAACSNSMCSASDTNSVQYNLVYYCCPSTPSSKPDCSGSTCVCPTQQSCNTAAIATWSSQNCQGDSTFKAVASGSSTTATCTNAPAAYGGIAVGQLNCASTTVGSTVVWRFAQWYQSSASQSTCTGSGVGTTFGVVGDLACYNMPYGSIVVDCSSNAASRVGTSISSPAFTSNTLISTSTTAPSPVSTSQVVYASWIDDACSAGSSYGWVASTSDCNNVVDSQQAFGFQASCASSTASATWTLKVWATSGANGGRAQCISGAPADRTITGTGKVCTPLSATDSSKGSVVIDCSSAFKSGYINTSPLPVNGMWTQWDDCQSSCTQTRTCSNPAPAYGGNACSGPSSQSCAGGSCTDNSGSNPASTSTSSGSVSSTGSGSAVTPDRTYAASAVFVLTFNAASNATSQASFINTVQSNVAAMAGVPTQQVKVTTVPASGRRLLQASSQLQVTILAASTDVAQAAYSQFQTAFTSTSTTTNPLLAQSVNANASPVAVYSATCADGSTKSTSSECGAGTVNNSASSSVACSWLSLAVASAAVVFHALRA